MLKELLEKRTNLAQKIDEAKTGAELDALELELRKLDNQIRIERAKLEQEEYEARQREKDAYNDANSRARGIEGQAFGSSQTKVTDVELRSATYSAIGKTIINSVLASNGNKNVLPLTDAELRAVSIATSASDKQSGNSNGGVVIPTTMLFDMLENSESKSSFIDRVTRIDQVGLVVFPYRKSTTVVGESATNELLEGASMEIEFGEFKLHEGNYVLVVGITNQLLTKAPEFVGEFIIAELQKQLRLILETAVFYGTGQTDGLSSPTRILGIFSSSETIKYEYDSANLYEELITMKEKLDKNYRVGATAFLASDIKKGILTKKNSNGDYIVNPITIKSVANVWDIDISYDDALKAGNIVVGNPENYIINFNGGEQMFRLGIQTNGVWKHMVTVYPQGAPKPKAFVVGTPKETGAAAKA